MTLFASRAPRRARPAVAGHGRRLLPLTPGGLALTCRATRATRRWRGDGRRSTVRGLAGATPRRPYGIGGYRDPWSSRTQSDSNGRGRDRLDPADQRAAGQPGPARRGHPDGRRGRRCPGRRRPGRRAGQVTWTPCRDGFQCATVARAAGLRPAGRREDLPLGDPAPRRAIPAGGSARCSSTRAVRAAPASTSPAASARSCRWSCGAASTSSASTRAASCAARRCAASRPSRRRSRCCRRSPSR